MEHLSCVKQMRLEKSVLAPEQEEWCITGWQGWQRVHLRYVQQSVYFFPDFLCKNESWMFSCFCNCVNVGFWRETQKNSLRLNIFCVPPSWGCLTVLKWLQQGFPPYCFTHIQYGSWYWIVAACFSSLRQIHFASNVLPSVAGYSSELSWLSSGWCAICPFWLAGLCWTCM